MIRQPPLENPIQRGNPRVISASKVQGTSVVNPAQESLGSISDVVLDKYDGAVRYAVLEFGGFLGMGSKLFALPWELLRYDPNVDAYVINIDKEVLKNAPGFDSDDWPDMGAAAFDTGIRRHYGLGDAAAGYGGAPVI
ncbi:MAG TPA: PRC-barrel domain-containing protein [Aliidongia sp.]|nr:PRC-barrel domain-containing protein [Aliidongia sp.]